MIEIKVKTLDSQNHSFTLEEDMTVRGFKEHIAESVNIPADSQRLIYCGRVLQDEKKLSDCNVNGKVIHLVQRAPPQPGQRQGQSTSQGQRIPNAERFRRAQIHGNTMYLGSMSIPSDVIEGTGFAQASPQLSHTLSIRRLRVANRMLRKVNDLLDRLDGNTSVPDNPSPDPPMSPMAQQIQIQTLDYSGTSVTNPVINNERMAEAVSAALNAAGLNNVTVYRDTEGPETSADNSQSATADEPQQSQSTPLQEQQTPSQSQQPHSNQQSEQQSTDPDDLPIHVLRRFARVSRLHPRVTQMGEMLDRYLHTQDRMRPYVERYRSLMREDPPVVSGSNYQQRLIDTVSEGLHYMSHACHSLSDIVVNMNQPPPRHLGCHPIIVQHSTIVQAGLPIQVEAHINLPDRNPSSGNNNNENNETEQSNSQPATSTSSNAESTSTSSDENARPPDTPNASQPSHVNISPFSSFFTLPNNVEVLMEVSPEAAMDSNSGEEQPQNNGTTNNNINHRVAVSGARITAGTFPWASVSPPDFLQNLMQAVAGHVVQSGVTGLHNVNFSPNSNQQTTSTEQSNSGTSGQNVQASSRSSTETHPTNTVFTRTTPRSHVLHPLSIGHFDPFLSCNSHHIRPRQSDPSSSASNNTSSTSSQTNQSFLNTVTTDIQSQSQTAPSASTNTTPNPNSAINDVARQILNLQQAIASNYQSGPNSSSIDAATRVTLQLLTGDIAQRNSGSRRTAENSSLSGLTVAQVLQQTGLEVNAGMGHSFIGDIIVIINNNMTVGEILNLRHGRWTSIERLRKPLRDYFRTTFPNVCEDSLAYNATSKFIEELKEFVENIFQFDEALQSRVNIVETVLNIIKTGILRILNLIFQFDPVFTSSHETFNAECQQTVTNLGANLTAVLRHSLPGSQTSLESVVSRILNGFLEGIVPAVRPLIVEIFVSQFHRFSTSIPQPPYSEIVPLLVYQTEQTSQRNTEPEPMEVEASTEKTDNEVPENNEVKTEDIPRTFSGHEILPSDWVPVIARDTVVQRREVNGGTLTPFSDAYLGGLPNKRRKLIEQQKPRLLVSPPPNSTVMSASLERLVKEGTNRAGVDEVEGAAAAVASDQRVRSAFGQAIKDCLKSKKKSPDFPDPARFPNATKYFSDDDRSKQ